MTGKYQPAIRSAKEYARWFASQGGKARKKALTPEQRRQSALKAIRARWAKAKKRPKKAK